MNYKLVSCLITLILAALVYGTENGELVVGEEVELPGIGYYRFGTNKNWWEAQKDCLSSNSKLAVINGEDELLAVLSYVRALTLEKYVYVGFANKYETQYVTTEGVLLKNTGYAEWEKDKPSNLTNRCGGMSTINGKFTDLDCDTVGTYVCERQLWTNYTYIDGFGYYKLHTTGKKWADASDTCVKEGGHLVVLNNQEEANTILKWYNDVPKFPNADWSYLVYIGVRAVFEDLTDQPYKGTFVTVLGTAVENGYYKWGDQEPVIRNAFFCGTLWRDGTYFMTTCNRNLAFFCEREA